MLNYLTNPSFILKFFVISFVLIQPSKIVAALTEQKFILGQFLIPIIWYFLSLFIRREHEQLKNHGLITIFQLAIIGVQSVFAELYFNTYFLLFIITPHALYLMKFLVQKNPESKFLFRTISFYVFGIFILSLFSIHYSKIDITFQTVLSTFDMNFFTRVTTQDRHRILVAINFGHYLFGLPRDVVEGVALTVYPLVLLSLFFLEPKMLKDKFVIPGVICSLIYILMKSSRGEIIFLMLLVGYPLAQKVFSKFRWPSLALIGFGYIQLVLGKQALNGRNILNNLFLDNLSMLGKGIGFSSDKILKLTHGNYSSFHNIHFEIITNFGFIIYGCFLAITTYFVLSSEYNRNKHFYLCLLFFLLATNFELFDFYFAVPLGYFAASYAAQANLSVFNPSQKASLMPSAG